MADANPCHAAGECLSDGEPCGLMCQKAVGTEPNRIAGTDALTCEVVDAALHRLWAGQPWYEPSNFPFTPAPFMGNDSD